MLDNCYAETSSIPAGVKPSARVFHPELRIETQPRQTEWGDRVWIEVEVIKDNWIEYVFEVDNVQMEMYQVI